MTACDCSSDADGEQMMDTKISCSRHAEMPAHQLRSSSTRERLREIGPLRSQARAEKDAWAREVASISPRLDWICGQMDDVRWRAWHGDGRTDGRTDGRERFLNDRFIRLNQ